MVRKAEEYPSMIFVRLYGGFDLEKAIFDNPTFQNQLSLSQYLTFFFAKFVDAPDIVRSELY